MKPRNNSQAGFELVETVVAITVFTIAGLALLLAYNFFIAASENAELETKAAYLGEEGLEAIRSIRDQGFTANIASLATNQNYYLSWSSTTAAWSVTTSPNISAGLFYRTFKLNSVYRDGNHDIAASGTLDPAARKATISVAWFRNGATTTKSFTTYFTNLFNN